MAGRRNEMDERAMAAARASLAARAGRRTSPLSLREAASRHSIGEKYVRMASALLQSDMTHLVWEVDSGNKKLRIAYGEYKTAKYGDRGNDPGPEGLYLIAETGCEKWCKIGIGIGRVAERFDNLQQGNPRRLRLVRFWQFNDLSDAKAVESRLFAMYPTTDGGAEWLSTVDHDHIYQMVVSAGGRWLLSVPGFDHTGLREPRTTGSG